LPYILFHAARSVGIQLCFFFKKCRICPEIDANMPFLLVRPIVEKRPKPGHANQPRSPHPTRIQTARPALQFPEVPANLELVSVVLVQHFQRVFHCEPRLRATLSIPKNMLKHGRFTPAHRPNRRCVHARLAAVCRYGLQYSDQLVSKRSKAQIRIPQAQIQCV